MQRVSEILIRNVVVMFPGSRAEQQQSLRVSNELVSLNSSEDKSEDVVEGPIREVLAQSGSTANLPCKITEPGAGTVNVVT